MHECPADGCETQVTDDLLMCRQHWRMVPALIKRQVYRAWRDGAGRGTNEHLEAMNAAIVAVNEAILAKWRARNAQTRLL